MTQYEDGQDITPEEAIQALSPRTLKFLGRIFDQPTHVFQAEIAEQKVGSRLGMEALEIVHLVDDEDGQCYKMTAFGWDVAQIATTMRFEED